MPTPAHTASLPIISWDRCFPWPDEHYLGLHSTTPSVRPQGPPPKLFCVQSLHTLPLHTLSVFLLGINLVLRTLKTQFRKACFQRAFHAHWPGACAACTKGYDPRSPSFSSECHNSPVGINYECPTQDIFTQSKRKMFDRVWWHTSLT